MTHLPFFEKRKARAAKGTKALSKNKYSGVKGRATGLSDKGLLVSEAEVVALEAKVNALLEKRDKERIARETKRKAQEAESATRIRASNMADGFDPDSESLEQPEEPPETTASSSTASMDIAVDDELTNTLLTIAERLATMPFPINSNVLTTAAFCAMPGEKVASHTFQPRGIALEVMATTSDQNQMSASISRPVTAPNTSTTKQ